jgi:hypothetical protein
MLSRKSDFFKKNRRGKEMKKIIITIIIFGLLWAGGNWLGGFIKKHQGGYYKSHHEAMEVLEKK